MRDAVVKKQAAWLQELVYLLEVQRQVLQTDVLEHAHAGNLVIGGGSVQIAVVAECHRDPVLQTGAGNALLRQLQLVLAQGNAMGTHAIVLRRMQDQTTPAAANVQQALTGLQAQLAADMRQLGLLRGLQRHVGLLKVGAGIHHGAVQPERIEGVGEVVVKGNGRAVFLPGVLSDMQAARTGPVKQMPAGLAIGLEIVAWQTQTVQHGRQPLAPGDVQLLQLVFEAQGGKKIAFDIDVTAKVSVHHAQGVPAQHHVANRGRAVADQHKAVRARGNCARYAAQL